MEWVNNGTALQNESNRGDINAEPACSLSNRITRLSHQLEDRAMLTDFHIDARGIELVTP